MILLEQLPSLVLFTLMLAMGMELTPGDFRRVASQPRAALLGLAGQLVFLPLLAFLIAREFAPSGPIAVGLLLIAACPGGTTSNAFSYLARGDVALSISLTACSSLVAFLWVPLVLGLAVPLLHVHDARVVLPFRQTAVPILLTTAVPVVAGMQLARHRPAFCSRWQQPLLKGSIGVLMLLIVGLPVQLAARSVDLPSIFRQAAAPVLLLLASTTGIALAASRLANVGRRRAITIAIEVGIQNFALAMMLALSVFREPTFLATGIVYLPAMLLVASGLVWLGRQASATPAPSPSRAG